MSGLTTRGRAFLSAGVAAALCAVVLGQTELLRVAVLILALPIVSAFVVVRTRYRVASTRHVEPGRVPAGTPAEVRLRVENVSRLPTGLLLLEDEVPYVLGAQPRFVIDRVESRGVREVRYPIRAEVRGVYRVGPLTVRLSDPFGLCELPRSFTSSARFVVTPAVHALPPVPLGGEWSGRGDSRSRSIAAAGEDDIATREYRYGDDLRRVHWRSTARMGELMVRREEQPWKNRASILLDTRRLGHVGDGPGSSFEWAVSAAASVAIHLSRRGYAVRLVTDTGLVIGGTSEGERAIGDVEGLILDALAVVTTSRNDTVREAAPMLARVPDSLLVAVLGAVDMTESAALARLRRGRSTAVGLLLDTASWSADGRRVDRPGADRWSVDRQSAARRRDDVGTAAHFLRRSGWRVVTARRDDDLAELWPQVGFASVSVNTAVTPEPSPRTRSAAASAPGGSGHDRADASDLGRSARDVLDLSVAHDVAAGAVVALAGGRPDRSRRPRGLRGTTVALRASAHGCGPTCGRIWGRDLPVWGGRHPLVGAPDPGEPAAPR